MSSSIFDRQAMFSKFRGSDGLDQAALIARLQQGGPSRIVTNKRKIPNGNLIPQLLTTEREIEEAVYTWLRCASEWEELTICFAKDPEKYQLREEVVLRFGDPTNPTPPWRRQGKSGNDGLWNLRETIAKALIKNDSVVKIEIDRKGVRVYLDRDKKFGPYRKATAKDVAAFNDAVKEELARRQAEAQAEGREWQPPEIPVLEVGMDIDNEEFEPYLEWVKEKRGIGIQ